jgi:hypothetical protein
MYLVINKFVTAVKDSNFSDHYLRNRSTSDIGVLGYIGILYHKEHPPEVWHIPPGTPCIDSSAPKYFYIKHKAQSRPTNLIQTNKSTYKNMAQYDTHRKL